MMKKPSKRRIREVIHRLLMSVVFVDADRKKPGALVKKMRKEDREILKHATSEDFYHRVKEWMK